MMMMMNEALLQRVPYVVVTVDYIDIATVVGLVDPFDGYHWKSSVHDDDVPVVDFAGVGIGRAKVHCRK